MSELSLRRHGLLFRARCLPDPGVEVTREADGVVLARWSVPECLDDTALEAAALDWIEVRLGAHPPAPTLCASCGVALTPVLGVDTDYQFRGALWVHFAGGFGMFVDAPVHAEALVAVLCGDCASDLCSSQAWVGAALGRRYT